MSETHTLTIKHDAESHKYDCHDDCTATLSCPEVTDGCRCWWECEACQQERQGMGTAELDEFDDRLSERSEAHGVEHQNIDGMWMVPTEGCVTQMLDTDANDFIGELPEGDHPVDFNCGDGFVYVIVPKQVAP